MSVTAWLQHISANGLEKAKKDPAVFEQVIMDLSSADSDAPLVSQLSELTPNQIDVLGEITHNIESVLNRWSIYDVEVLEDLKNIFPETYSRLKSDLYSIVADEKDCLCLDLNRSWGQVSHIFRGQTKVNLSAVVSNVENKHWVNIFSGKSLDPDDPFLSIRYQEAREVVEMAESLSKIDESEIRQRFEEALRAQAPVYRYRWEKESYPVLLEYCREVKDFYQLAANRGFGVVNAIS